MALADVLLQLRDEHTKRVAEVARLSQAIEALSSLDNHQPKRKRGRNLSAAARARIAAAQRARWAAFHRKRGVSGSDVKPRKKKHWTQTVKGRKFMAETAAKRFGKAKA